MFGSAQDCDEIRQVIARYCHYLDSVQPNAVAALFSHDAVLDVAGSKFEGAEAIKAYYEQLRAVYDVRPMMHYVTNVVIDVDGEEATSQSYILVLNPAVTIAIITAGRYNDRLRRIDGQWRFVERHVILGGVQD